MFHVPSPRPCQFHLIFTSAKRYYYWESIYLSVQSKITKLTLNCDQIEWMLTRRSTLHVLYCFITDTNNFDSTDSSAQSKTFAGSIHTIRKLNSIRLNWIDIAISMEPRTIQREARQETNWLCTSLLVGCFEIALGIWRREHSKING